MDERSSEAVGHSNNTTELVLVALVIDQRAVLGIIQHPGLLHESANAPGIVELVMPGQTETGILESVVGRVV